LENSPQTETEHDDPAAVAAITTRAFVIRSAQSPRCVRSLFPFLSREMAPKTAETLREVRCQSVRSTII
jgi:hypothetical protein